MVRHLLTYINDPSNKRTITYKVRIEDEITKYKKKYPGAVPVVIFDYMSCLSIAVETIEDIFLAGRHEIASQRATEFCEKFKKLGVEMIFFLDGAIKNSKIPYWIKSSNTKYATHQETIFKQIREGHSDKVKFSYKFKKLSVYNSNFFQIIRKYGKVYISLENECDLDLAEYATRVKAFAVFTPDTDFLIYRGDWRIWSAHYFNLQKFDTVSWNKYFLRKKLNLLPNQMSLFALLCGNDIIDLDVVQHIIDGLTDSDNKLKKQDLVAGYIRNNFPSGLPLKKNDMEKLIDLIYNDGKNHFNRNIAKCKVYDSLNMYHYGKRKIPKVEKWLKDHIQSTNSVVVYQILFSTDFTINQSWIDMSNEDLKSYSELVLPLVLKQFGIVLNKDRHCHPKRIVYYKPDHSKPFQAKEFEPIYPQNSIPKLQDLLETEVSRTATLEEKFKLLAWSITPPIINEFKYEFLMEMRDNVLLVPVIACNNLVKESQIKVYEADVLLLSINEVMKSSPEKSNSIAPPKLINSRSMWIAHTYNRYIDILRNSFICCGLHFCLKLSFFNGFVFHKMHEKFEQLSSADKLKIIDPIAKYRIYV